MFESFFRRGKGNKAAEANFQAGEKISEDNLRNEDYLKEVFANSDTREEEIKQIAAYHHFSEEEVKLFSYFSRLRGATIKGMEDDLAERRFNNPWPTEAELNLGGFQERLEPQVRETVLNLRDKGYDTFESGFAGFKDQSIGLEKNQFSGLELPPELLTELGEQGVAVEIDSRKIKLILLKELDLPEITQVWQKIEKFIPSLGVSAEPCKLQQAKGFRKRMQDNRDWEKQVEGIDAWSEAEANNFATKKLASLNLSLEDFKDKKVLDIGSGPQFIERAARAKGIDSVFSLDCRPYAMSKRPELKNRLVADISKGIKGVADSYFDRLISLAGPPSTGTNRTEKQYSQTINEMLRILKNGGEARISSVSPFFIREIMRQKYGRRYDELFSKYLAADVDKQLSGDELAELKKIEAEEEGKTLEYLTAQGVNAVKEKNKNGSNFLVIKK